MADPVTISLMALQAAGTGLSVASTLAGGDAAKKQGRIGMIAANQEAAGYREQANEARAVAQRERFEIDRRTDQVQSRLQAVAASGGGGADDPTIIKLGQDIAGQGEYEALAAMYRGENRARGLLDQASGAEARGVASLYEGKNKKSASQMSALSTLIGGATGMFGTYSKSAGTGTPSVAPNFASSASKLPTVEYGRKSVYG